MSNFTFLQADWPELYATACEAEQHVTSTPLSHRLYAFRSPRGAVKWLYANDSFLQKPYADNLAALIHGLRLRSAPDCCLVPERYRREILTIQKIGNLAATLLPIFQIGRASWWVRV